MGWLYEQRFQGRTFASHLELRAELNLIMVDKRPPVHLQKPAPMEIGEVSDAPGTAPATGDAPPPETSTLQKMAQRPHWSEPRRTVGTFRQAIRPTAR